MSRLTHVISVCLFVLLLVPSLALGSHVGVYFDESGDSSVRRAGALETFRWWVVAKGVPSGITAYQFYVEVAPEIIVLERATNPVNALNIGSADDWMVGTGTCLYGGSVSLVSYSGMLVSDSDMVRIGLDAASISPTALGPAYLECGADAVKDFDSISAAVLNVNDDSWGGVKSLYGN